MTVYHIPDALAGQYHGAGYALAATAGGQMVAQALQQLLDAGYADSKSGVIARALIDAEKRSSA